MVGAGASADEKPHGPRGYCFSRDHPGLPGPAEAVYAPLPPPESTSAPAGWVIFASGTLRRRACHVMRRRRQPFYPTRSNRTWNAWGGAAMRLNRFPRIPFCDPVPIAVRLQPCADSGRFPSPRRGVRSPGHCQVCRRPELVWTRSRPASWPGRRREFRRSWNISECPTDAILRGERRAGARGIDLHTASRRPGRPSSWARLPHSGGYGKSSSMQKAFPSGKWA